MILSASTNRPKVYTDTNMVDTLLCIPVLFLFMRAFVNYLVKSKLSSPSNQTDSAAVDFARNLRICHFWDIFRLNLYSSCGSRLSFIVSEYTPGAYVGTLRWMSRTHSYIWGHSLSIGNKKLIHPVCQHHNVF